MKFSEASRLPLPQQAEKARLTGILMKTLWCITPATIVYIFLGSYLLPQFASSGIVHILLLILMTELLSWWLTQRGHVVSAGWLLCLTLWVALMLIAYFFGGINSPALIALICVTLTAGILLGERGVIFLALLSTAGSLLIFTLQVQDKLPESSLSISEMYIILSLVSVIIVVALLLLLMLRSLRQVLEQMNNQSAALTHEMSERQQTEEQLQRVYDSVKRAKQEWEATVDSLEQIIALLDKEQRVLRVNRAAEHWGLGDVRQVRGQLAGALFSAVLAGSFQQELNNAWENLQSEAASTFELVDPVTRRCVRVQLRPISINTYRMDAVLDSYAVLVLTDITTQKHMAAQALESERLRVQLALEKEVLHMREGFISVISHEFRTPLAVIKSSRDMLERYHEQLTAQRRLEHLHRIDDQISLLSDMIDQVLLINQATEQRVQVRPERLDLPRFLRELLEEMQQSSGASHPLKFQSSESFELVSMDPRLLRQIITNLISNAIKYSPSTAPVEVTLERDGGWVVLTVRDYGIGIPQADQLHLFEPFYRAANAYDIKGTGLGMTIIKNAVEALNGTLAFRSEEKAGTQFIVRLPIEPPEGGVALSAAPL